MVFMLYRYRPKESVQMWKINVRLSFDILYYAGFVFSKFGANIVIWSVTLEIDGKALDFTTFESDQWKSWEKLISKNLEKW